METSLCQRQRLERARFDLRRDRPPCHHADSKPCLYHLDYRFGQLDARRVFRRNARRDKHLLENRQVFFRDCVNQQVLGREIFGACERPRSQRVIRACDDNQFVTKERFQKQLVVANRQCLKWLNRVGHRAKLQRVFASLRQLFALLRAGNFD